MVFQEAVTRSTHPNFQGLVSALGRLDGILSRAILAFKQMYGSDVELDPFRGLHIRDEDVNRWMAVAPGSSLLSSDLEGIPSEGHLSAWDWLSLEYGLSPFDLDVLLVALAPEIDLRYERIYAYLQDDVTRRSPSVDLALNLLCGSGEEKLLRRSHFYPDAPLVANDLIRLSVEARPGYTPFLSQTLQVDEQVISLTLGEIGLDRRLAAFAQLLEPEDHLAALPIDEEVWLSISGLAKRAWFSHAPLWFYFQGAAGSGRGRVAETLARAIGARLLRVDLSGVISQSEQAGLIFRVLFREARLKKALLLLTNCDLLHDPVGFGLRQGLYTCLQEDRGITILCGSEPWRTDGTEPVGIQVIPFSIPSFERRRSCWQVSLAEQNISVDSPSLDALAGRFRLTVGQIKEAAVSARLKVGLFPVGRKRPVKLQEAALFAAARAQSGQQSSALTQRIDPRYSFGDIVLPEDASQQLREICERVAFRPQVMGVWGFERKLSLGKGVTALFTGPSGTGKTMAAEIIAHELGLYLCKVDLSAIVSKYIGETEKNLSQVFAAAENSNDILFFDEADALFGKRSEVRDSHDRYANIETSYLLQKMEQFEGIAILATNLMQNLDEAFMRRLSFVVTFPFPDEASRRRIWHSIWPEQMPLDSQVDMDFLASVFKVSGGNIKNIAVAAAFLAAQDGSVVKKKHLIHAAFREYQKIGKVMPEIAKREELEEDGNPE